MQAIEFKQGQTLLDTALEAYGSLEGIFEILAVNPDLNMHSTPAQGTVIKAGTDLMRREIVKYYLEKEIIPATAVNFDVEAYLNLINQKMATQIVDESIIGNHTFPGGKLENLYKNLTIQITYFITQPITVYVEQSLDGVSWDPIPGAEYTLDKTLNSHTFNFVDLLTKYARVRVEATGISGVIEKIEYLV